MSGRGGGAQRFAWEPNAATAQRRRDGGTAATKHAAAAEAMGASAAQAAQRSLQERTQLMRASEAWSIFAKRMRVMVGKLPEATVNSQRTVFPRATRPYRIVIAELVR